MNVLSGLNLPDVRDQLVKFRAAGDDHGLAAVDVQTFFQEALGVDDVAVSVSQRRVGQGAGELEQNMRGLVGHRRADFCDGLAMRDQVVVEIVYAFPFLRARRSASTVAAIVHCIRRGTVAV